MPRFKQPVDLKAATAVDVETAQRLARLSLKGRCWRNALMAMMPYEDRENICYVEGWLILLKSECAIEHGWLKIDEKIVDVTLPGEYPPDHYYGVFEYSFDEVGKYVDRYRGVMPFFNETKSGRKAMRDAFELLPLNYAEALLWAYLALAHTGIRSIVLEDH